MTRRLGVLISGRGSNLQAIVDATRSGALDATIAIVISNREHAAGLARAREAGIEAVFLNPRDYADRDAYDRALVDTLRARGVSVVCLAGYMRLVGVPMLEAFPNRIVNIHPSLLPAFRGLDAQQQALEHGVAITGATVHIVNADLDAGPILMQAAVPVMPGDTVESLSARILVEEHRMYPLALARLLDGATEPLATSHQPPAAPPPVTSHQPPATSHRPPPDALVTAIPFRRDEAFRIVHVRTGSDALTERLRDAFPRSTIKTFSDPFDPASLVWWDAMFGADLVIAAFVMPKLNEAKTQYFYKAVADRVSPRGGVLVLDRVGAGHAPLLHQLVWLKHAGFADVDCHWLVDGVAVFGGFTRRAAAASGSPPPAGN